MKALDLFCGLGGWSDGLELEGFDVLGVEIERKIAKLYKHDVIVADVRTLDGENFKGYDLIVGSPPCRDFSLIGRCFGHRWKRKPNSDKGLELINVFLDFVEDGKPKYWLMENVAEARRFILVPYQTVCYFQTGKRHVLWGDFPPFLIPKIKNTFYTKRTKSGIPYSKVKRSMQKWLQAKIPLPIARALGRAVKEALT